VFADPFSVSLHAITRHPPPRSGRVLVYGAGSLGLCAGSDPARALTRMWRGRRRALEAQAELARGFGAAKVLAHEPRLAIIEELVAWAGPAAATAARSADGPTPARRRGLRHRRQARDV